MSDNPQNPQQPAPQAQDPAPQPQNNQNPQQPGPVPYERFQEVNRSYQELKAKLDQIETAQKTAQEAKLKEDGKLQELLTTRERELAEERSKALRLTVATKKGLVGELAALADRLRGSTEAELEADADALLALAKKPGGPGVPPPSGGGRPGTPLDLSKMTPAEIREALAKGQIKFS